MSSPELLSERITVLFHKQSSRHAFNRFHYVWDEVLRGTNTVERIAASTEILRSLSGGNCICFAATHDIELTHLLENIYHNYHFAEEIAEDDIFFSYKIMNGRATTRNAIRLLGIMGYDQKIIKEAEQMADHFMKTGKWHGLD